VKRAPEKSGAKLCRATLRKNATGKPFKNAQGKSFTKMRGASNVMAEIVARATSGVKRKGYKMLW
jgi:hypothetical protein